MEGSGSCGLTTRHLGSVLVLCGMVLSGCAFAVIIMSSYDVRRVERRRWRRLTRESSRFRHFRLDAAKDNKSACGDIELDVPR